MKRTISLFILAILVFSSLALAQITPDTVRVPVTNLPRTSIGYFFRIVLPEQISLLFVTGKKDLDKRVELANKKLEEIKATAQSDEMISIVDQRRKKLLMSVEDSYRNYDTKTKIEIESKIRKHNERLEEIQKEFPKAILVQAIGKAELSRPFREEIE